MSCSSSGNPTLTTTTGLTATTGSAPASSYIIYRDHKYYGLPKRVFHYSLVLIRFYITEPMCRRLHQIQNYLIELCGFVLLLLLVPFLCAMGLGVYVSRRTRVHLIRRFYPALDVCDDFSLGSSFKTTDSIVSAVIWIDGQITVEDLQARYKDHATADAVAGNGTWILEKYIGSKLGIAVARHPKHQSFDVHRHIMETSPAPAIVYNPTAHDIDEHSQQGQKARLQKMIAGILSRPITGQEVDAKECPQWEIVLIPVQIPAQQQQYARQKTCCILRFHHVLLQDSNVRQFLDDVFNGRSLSTIDTSQEQDPLSVVQHGFKILKARLSQCTMRKIVNIIAGVKISHADVMSLNWLRSIDWRTLSVQLGRSLRVAALFLRSLSSIPIEVLQNSVWRSQHSEHAFGFSKLETVGQQEIAWSSVINKELVESIKEKIGHSATTESVILCAISMGLNQYYVDTRLPNPGILRIAIPILTTEGFKSATIRTNTVSRSSYGNEKYVLWSNLLSLPYPSWKAHGSNYLHTYISHLVPRCLASALSQRSYRRRPIQLIFVDLDGRAPIWGHHIEEISCWRASVCAHISICLVNSTQMQSMRLIVQSPMKLLATSLTRHLDSYLNEIAEMVGVEKANRVQYHRKSSSSSHLQPLPLANAHTLYSSPSR